MKKYFVSFVSILLIVCCSDAKAQVVEGEKTCATTIYAQQAKSTMDLLTQREWKIVFEINKDFHVESTYTYTTTEFIDKSKGTGTDGFELKFKYYLSDKRETVFDSSKVGKIQNGDYIIKENELLDVSIHKIVKISDSELEIIPVTRVNSQSTTRSSKDEKTFIFRAKD